MDPHSLGLNLRIGGNVKAPLTFDIERPLELTDLEQLGEKRGSVSIPIKKLRERHHALAKCLAQGMKDGDAGLICGYSASRVSILKADTAFNELILFYQNSSAERFIDAKIALQELGMDALEDIREKMEDEENELPLGDLLAIAKLTLDRSGFGPSTKTTVDVKIGLAERMAQAQDRLTRMRDVTPNE
jgi:hypothetical protein